MSLQAPKETEELDPIELELQGVVFHLTWLLGIELRPLENQYMLLICEPYFQPKR